MHSVSVGIGICRPSMGGSSPQVHLGEHRFLGLADPGVVDLTRMHQLYNEREVESTLARCCFDIVCLLGIASLPAVI